MKIHSKKNFLSFYLVAIIQTINFGFSLPLFGEDLTLSNSNDISSEYLRKNKKGNFYILGPGDILDIKVTIIDTDLDKEFLIDREGFALLERLNRIYVQGLTIDELTDLLNKEYSKFVKTPDVKLSIKQYRPVNFYIDGEVIRPGSYTYEFEDIRATKINTFNTNMDKPSITDAIKLSGGITHFANLEDIRIIRKNSISEGGGKITTKVNISKVINLEDPSQNIKIYDGDTIYVSKSDEPVSQQISRVMKNNLNPATVRVFVGGRVFKPGFIEAPRGIALNDAIMMSGGSKIIKGPVQFLRYSGDEMHEKRRFRLNKEAEKGTYKNPYLTEGDVVYVGKNLFNITSEVITDVTEPFRGIFTFYGLYKAIED